MSDEIDKTIERVSDPNYKPKTLFEAGMQENVRLVAAWAAEQIMGTTQLNLEEYAQKHRSRIPDDHNWNEGRKD